MDKKILSLDQMRYEGSYWSNDEKEAYNAILLYLCTFDKVFRKYHTLKYYEDYDLNWLINQLFRLIYKHKFLSDLRYDKHLIKLFINEPYDDMKWISDVAKLINLTECHHLSIFFKLDY